MIDRLPFLWPEIALFAATCVVMVLGLSRDFKARKACAAVAALGLIASAVLAATQTPAFQSWTFTAADSAAANALTETTYAGQRLLPNLPIYLKTLIPLVALILLLPMAGTVDRSEEAAIRAGRRAFDPLRSNRAEFYAFFLFSITGLMLCAGADDLVWLFLALELTSLPTYIMVAISTARNRSREAAVKYFFLGALGAAVFLYGFALVYGGTGSTNLNVIADHFRTFGINQLALAGVLLSLLGFAFKIAAVPMHFYTPDVYEGAAPQVSGFLAFVPKTAGFIAILLLCAAVGWTYGPASVGVGPLFQHAATETVRPTPGGTQLPELVRLLLWVMAALTMTVGNVLAILQSSVKRILAYSSIAHSGYMLVGVVSGPGDGSFTGSGVVAVMFYLLAYGVMNAGTFAVLAALERAPDKSGEPREIDQVQDLRGLCATHPMLGWTMVVCSLSLLGLPPLLGFFGKLPLFTSGIAAGQTPLVVILGINSAIAAFYYLRLAFTPLLEKADDAADPIVRAPFRARAAGAALSAAGVIVLSVAGGYAMSLSTRAGAVVPAGGYDIAPVTEDAVGIDPILTYQHRKLTPPAGVP